MLKCTWTFVSIAILFSSSATGAVNDFASREPRYQLHPGDVITVNYRYTPEYDATVTLEPDGFVSLPLLGGVKVSGLTLDDALALFKAKAAERLNDPEMTMELKDFEKPHVIVGGEVGTPGKLEFRGHMTALQAVEMSGGFRTSAKSSQILLIRQINGVEAETRLIDLNKVISKHQLQEDIELRAGDLVIVPKNRIAKIEPLIRLANPGTYGMYLNPAAF